MQNKKELKLLLTCCLGYYMKDTIACFKASEEYNITVVGADMNPMDYNINDIDVFYQVPASNAPNYFDVIFDIAKKENVDVVMPLHSKELVPFGERRQLFEELGMILAVPDLEGLKIANDKILSYEFMKEIGLPTPPTIVTDNSKTAIDFVKKNSDIVFVTKLPDSCGARGFNIISDGKVENLNGFTDDVIVKPEQLENIIDGSCDILLQGYLCGKEYTVDLVLKDGKCIGAYTKECTLMEHGVIRQAKIVDYPEAGNLCIKFAEALKLNGNIGFDLKCDKDGTPMIIDVNPRLTATVALGRYAGLNLPLLGLDCYLGKDIKETAKVKTGITIVRQIADYYFAEDGKQLTFNTKG